MGTKIPCQLMGAKGERRKRWRALLAGEASVPHSLGLSLFLCVPRSRPQGKGAMTGSGKAARDPYPQKPSGRQANRGFTLGLGKHRSAAGARDPRAPCGVHGRRAGWLLEDPASPLRQVAGMVFFLFLRKDSERGQHSHRLGASAEKRAPCVLWEIQGHRQAAAAPVSK